MSSRTALISHFCDDPFGAVKLALGPSCYTAEPSSETSATDRDETR